MRNRKRIGRNTPCPCGSGLKYKKCCHLRKTEDKTDLAGATDTSPGKQKRRLYFFQMEHGDWGHNAARDPSVVKCWADIRKEISDLSARFDRLYVDSDGGMPDFHKDGVWMTPKKCRFFERFNAGPMWPFFAWLGRANPGMKWMPCDQHQLLMEFQSLRRKMARMAKEVGGDRPVPVETWKRIKDLIAMRDQFIAERIDKDLQHGEVGILFLGAMHNEQNRLVDTLESRGVEVEIIDVRTDDRCR